MLGGAVAGLPTSAAAAASAAAVAVAAHKQFHPNSPPLDLESWKEAFLQQANNNTTNGNSNKNVSSLLDYLLSHSVWKWSKMSNSTFSHILSRPELTLLRINCCPLIFKSFLRTGIWMSEEWLDKLHNKICKELVTLYIQNMSQRSHNSVVKANNYQKKIKCFLVKNVKISKILIHYGYGASFWMR